MSRQASSEGGRPIFRLAAPLIALFLVQNAVAIAALAMMGGLGEKVLAGVGAANALYGVLLALFYGFDTGVQAVTSRTVGAGAGAKLGKILNDALVLALPLSAAVAVMTALAGPHVLGAMLTDRAAAAAGSAYLAFAAPSLVFLAATIPMNAVWIGSGRPAIAFLVTLLSAPIQIGLTYVLVYGLGPIAPMGAAGAGLAFTLSTILGAGFQFALALGVRPIPGFLRDRPHTRGVATIATVGWPVSIQQSLSQLGLLAAFVIVARLGAAQVATINVLATLTLVPIQCATGFGVAAATLVGQTLGRDGAAEQARRWGWRTATIGSLVLAPIGLALIITPGFLIGLFLHNPATARAAEWPARILGLGVGLDAFGRILAFALRGAGATKTAAAIGFIRQWFLQLPLMAWIGLTLAQGVLGMVAVQVALAALESLILGGVWASGLWVRVRIAGFEAISPPSSDSATAPTGARRIAVLGGAGAGKSTFARRLGDALRLPVIHLDRIAYGPGWERLPAVTTRARLIPPLGEESWIVEGTYPELADLTLPAADCVVWLAQPAALRLFRSWRKARLHRDRPRADRPDDCAEGFSASYALAVLRFGRFTPAVRAWLKELRGRDDTVVLRGDRATAAFLAAVAPTATISERAPA